MRVYRPDATRLRFAAPSTLVLLVGAATAVVAAPMCALIFMLIKLGFAAYILPFVTALMWVTAFLIIISIVAVMLAAGMHFLFDDADRIRWQVLRGLCCPSYGNPLHLKEGERLPVVTCRLIGPGTYRLKVAPGGTDFDSITKLAPDISASLRGRYRDYAVTLANSDVTFGYVTFTLENVKVSRTLCVSDVSMLQSGGATELIVQENTYIDLTTSGSMLFAGKTRSGKTTAIICLLLQVLQAGRDDFGSEVIIIDPKQAELSRLPHVVTLDKDGEAMGILDALRHFSKIVAVRQQVLNDLSEQRGDAVHWWNASMHPSLLFLDEYVACRTLFPAKPPKGNEDYCLATFDGLVKRIVTMGASAGCYVIISIAEASVQDGGLPSMLRSAMSTKVLMRPTMPEARLLWSPEQLEALAASARVYGPGDAWFSSTDGEHDNVSYVHFPRMEFPVYQELGRLLKEYYGD